MNWLFPTLVVLFAIISLAMVLIILVQRPQGGGLASAFGGGGNQDTAFGGRTGDALTIATVSTFALWLLVAIGLNVTDRMSVATPATETPASETASMETPPAGTDAAAAPGSAPSIAVTPQPLSPEETARLLSPTATDGVITPDKPVIQPGLDGLPSDRAPSTTPPADPAPAAEPAPAQAPTPAPAPAPAPAGNP
jgi:protein translocase SecG subunit